MRAIRNATRDVVLHPSASLATTWISHAVGLMFQSPADRALIFVFGAPREIAVHTFFVRGALDALVLDSELRAIAAAHALLPFRTWAPRVRGSFLVELPPGTLAATGTEVGDRIDLPAP